MFAAEVWGTVADVFAALGTVGALGVAVYVYARDTWTKRRAQASLIRVEYEDPLRENQRFSLRVRNLSDRPIVGIWVLWSEKSLARTLFAGEKVYAPTIGKKPVVIDGVDYGLPLMMNSLTPAKAIKRSKSEIFGFDGHRGIYSGTVKSIDGDSFAIIGVGEAEKSSPNAMVYRLSRRHWLSFQDADGGRWLLEVVQNKDSIARLRYLRNDRALSSRIGMHQSRSKHALARMRLAPGVAIWLVRNRRQRTMSELPSTEQSDPHAVSELDAEANNEANPPR